MGLQESNDPAGLPDGVPSEGAVRTSNSQEKRQARVLIAVLALLAGLGAWLWGEFTHDYFEPDDAIASARFAFAPEHAQLGLVVAGLAVQVDEGVLVHRGAAVLDGLVQRLERLDVPAGHRPRAGRWAVPTPDEQKPVLVQRDGTDGDDGSSRLVHSGSRSEWCMTIARAV